jgi:hypothetical protein
MQPYPKQQSMLRDGKPFGCIHKLQVRGEGQCSSSFPPAEIILILFFRSERAKNIIKENKKNEGRVSFVIEVLPKKICASCDVISTHESNESFDFYSTPNFSLQP